MKSKWTLIILAAVTLGAWTSCFGATCTGGIWPGDLNKDCYVKFDDFAIIAQNWLGVQQTNGDQLQVKDVATYRVYAKDCTITSTPDAGTYGVGAYAGVLGDYVYIMLGNGAHNAMGTGTLTINQAIPDGKYEVKIHYQTGAVHSHDSGAMAVSMNASGTGSYTENGNVNGVGGWKTYYPAEDFGVLGSTWYDTWFASSKGSSGWFCPVWSGSDLPTSITVTGINGTSGKLQLSIMDSEYQNYDFAVIDYIEFVQKSIVLSNSVMSIAAFAADPAWPSSYVSGGSGSDVILMAGPGAYNAMGWGTIAFNQAIPDGTYTVSIRYQTGAVHSSDSGGFAVSMGKPGGGAYNENGNEGTQHNGWKTYYPADNFGVLPSHWYDAQFAGPQGSAGWFCPVWSGSPLPTSISVVDINGVSNRLALSIMDSIYNNYDFAIIHSVELTPMAVPLRYEAENCTITNGPLDPAWPGAPVVGTDGMTKYVIIEGGPGAYNAKGSAALTVKEAIPDGDYYLKVRYQTGAVHTHDSGGMAVSVGATHGTVIENGIATQNGWHTYYPASDNGVTGSTWYTTWFASEQGSAGWFAPVWAGSPLPTSLTLKNIEPNDFAISFMDDIYVNYDFAVIDYIQLVPVTHFAGDLNADKTVDMKDLKMLAAEWLKCNDSSNPNCHDIICPNTPALGITEYTAYPVSGMITLDGNLTEWPAFDYNPVSWCASHWIPLGKVYYGTVNTTPGSGDIENTFLCLMYDGAANVLYGAVIADDYDGSYWNCSSTFQWDAQDDLEIYVQGDRANNTPSSPYGTWANGQQFVLGLCSDLSTVYKLWPDGVLVGGHSGETDPGFQATVKRTAGANFLEHMVYEFKVVPYDNYGSFNSTPTVQSDLYSGKTLGFDVVLAVKSPNDSLFPYGMLCPNLQTGKAYDVRKYATVTCQ